MSIMVIIIIIIIIYSNYFTWVTNANNAIRAGFQIGPPLKYNNNDANYIPTEPFTILTLYNNNANYKPVLNTLQY